VAPKIAQQIRERLAEGHGILKVAALVGVGSSTVQRIKREGFTA
jgi:DNA invertase Pin-like site-specific DNA recombinase